MLNFVKKYGWFFILLIVLFPFMANVLLSTPSSDDFARSVQLMGSNKNLFLASIEQTNAVYMQFGGGWPFNFYQYIFNPVYLFGPLSKLYGVLIFVFFILFILAIYVFTKMLFKHVFYIPISKIRWYFVLVLTLFLNTNLYPRVFTYFVGSSYMVECTFILFSTALTIFYFRKNPSCFMIIFLSILGFVTAFAFQLAPFMGLYYILEIYASLRRKDFTFVKVIPFIFMLVGGLISCFSPGNFARHAISNGNNFGILEAILNSFQNAICCYIGLLKKPFLVFILLLFVFLGYRNCKNCGWCSVFVLAILQFGCCFLLCFASALGYGNNKLPNTELFWLYLFASLNCSVLCFLIGHKLQSIKLLQLNDNFLKTLGCIFFSVLIVVAFMPSPQTINKEQSYSKETTSYVGALPWVYTIQNLSNILKENRYYKSLIKQVAYSNESDVVIYVDTEELKKVETGCLSGYVTFASNPSIVCNEQALFFHRNSVTISSLSTDFHEDLYGYPSFHDNI